MGMILPSPDSPREQLRILMAKKEAIEAEMSTHFETLKANNNSTMKSPLIDADGFPRADIDLYAVRGARMKLIELRNDLTAVTTDIAKGLETVYDPALRSQVTASSSSPKETKLKPFARVDQVAPSSPASEAGLKKDDLIVKFGDLTYCECGASLQPIGGVVATNEDQIIPLRIRRGPPDQIQYVFLDLKPRKGWGGRGLIGCHIVPYS